MCVCVCARSRDSPQRIASARQLVSVHNWMTSSGRRAPDPSYVFTGVSGEAAVTAATKHTHTQCALVLAQVRVGSEEDMRCVGLFVA